MKSWVVWNEVKHDDTKVVSSFYKQKKENVSFVEKTKILFSAFVDNISDIIKNK